MCASSDHEHATAQPAVTGTVFKVKDMTCTHCAGTIGSALKTGLPGTEFSIDLDRQEVTVTGDAAKAEALIRDAGYEPRLLVH